MKEAVDSEYSAYVLLVSKQKKDCFIIFLLVELSGHGLGFALVLANYCFLAVLSKKVLKFRWATLLIQWNCCSLVHWQYNINLIPKCEHDFNLIWPSSWINNFNQLHIFYGTCLRDLIAFLSMTEVCWKCDVLHLWTCWQYKTVRNVDIIWKWGQIYKHFVKNVKVLTVDVAKERAIHNS